MSFMAAKTDPFSDAEVSLVRGGLFHRVLQLVGLDPNRRNLGRRVLALIAVGWLPLLLITALSNWEGLPSLFADYRVYSRVFVAIPVLLLGEQIMESRFREVFANLRHADLLETPDLAYMGCVTATLVRLRDSFLPELVILMLSFVRTFTAYKGLVDATPWLGQGTGADFHLTAAGWYSIVVTVTLEEFLFGLGLWRWLLWTLFAFKLSTRKLKLVPTHPDEQGGLGFLGHTSLAFAPLAFAVTLVIGTNWRQEILHHGAHLTNFKLPAIAFIVIVALVAFVPLLFFVPRLAALRHEGIIEYGLLGQRISTDFHAKWILRGAGDGPEFLREHDSSAINSLGQEYKRIDKLTPFPADRVAVLTLAAAVAIPALPTLLAEIPLAVVFKVLFTALR
jgi:hypothetical protein